MLLNNFEDSFFLNAAHEKCFIDGYTQLFSVRIILS